MESTCRRDTIILGDWRLVEWWRNLEVSPKPNWGSLKLREFSTMLRRIGRVGSTGNTKITLILLAQAIRPGSTPCTTQMEQFNGRKCMLCHTLTHTIFAEPLSVKPTMIAATHWRTRWRSAQGETRRYTWMRICTSLTGSMCRLVRVVQSVFCGRLIKRTTMKW